jgi:hypothetical protein
MASVDLKFEVGDLVIPNYSRFKGDECKIVKFQPSGSILVETLNPDNFGQGHTGSGVLSADNGWNYPSSDLVHSFRYGFKIGDRVKTENGLGVIRCFNKQYGTLGVAHDRVIPCGHTIDGYCDSGYGRFYTKNELKHFTEELEKPDLPFKVGDRVKINPSYMNGSSIGVVKKVKDQLTTSPIYGVEFSQYDSALHDLDGDCELGYGWYYLDYQLKLTTESSEPMTPVTPEKRFTVGQKVTYKSTSSLGRDYKFGGEDHGGFVGEIVEYREFLSDRNCYKIRVTSKDPTSYTMLEDEFEDYLDPAFTAKKASISESAFTSSSEPAKRFKVGDKVTYKPKDRLPNSKYHFGGEDQGFFVGTIRYYGSYRSDFGCYPIDVTSKEGFSYTMLESEFVEYESASITYTEIGGYGDYKAYSGSSVVGASGFAGTTGKTIVSAGMWAGIMEEEFKKRDEAKKQDLSDYIQAPSVLKKKSTKRKLVIVDRF